MDYPENYNLIREALVREIRDASRWKGVVDAWQALLNVRIRAMCMQREREHLSGSGEITAGGKDDSGQ
jgi:hypothetical protein